MGVPMMSMSSSAPSAGAAVPESLSSAGPASCPSTGRDGVDGAAVAEVTAVAKPPITTVAAATPSSCDGILACCRACMPGGDDATATTNGAALGAAAAAAAAVVAVPSALSSTDFAPCGFGGRAAVEDAIGGRAGAAASSRIDIADAAATGSVLPNGNIGSATDPEPTFALPKSGRRSGTGPDPTVPPGRMQSGAVPKPRPGEYLGGADWLGDAAGGAATLDRAAATLGIAAVPDSLGACFCRAAAGMDATVCGASAAASSVMGGAAADCGGGDPVGDAIGGTCGGAGGGPGGGAGAGTGGGGVDCATVRLASESDGGSLCGGTGGLTEGGRAGAKLAAGAADGATGGA